MPWQDHPATGKCILMSLATSNKINMPCMSRHSLRPTPARQTLSQGQQEELFMGVRSNVSSLLDSLNASLCYAKGLVKVRFACCNYLLVVKE